MDGGEESVDRVEAVLGEVAAQAGGTVPRGPQPGREVRRVVLVDQVDEWGTMSEVAILEDDGMVRVQGHDRGARVSQYFGRGITS
jgi:hypothetical protein